MRLIKAKFRQRHHHHCHPHHHHFICPIVCTSTSIQLRRAGQQGPTRTLTAALKRVDLIKQLLGTYSTTQVKYYIQTRKRYDDVDYDHSYKLTLLR